MDVVTKDDVLDSGLTSEQAEDILILASTIDENPMEVDALLRKANIIPDPDPQIKFYQMLQARVMPPAGFDFDSEIQADMFLAGIGAALGKAAAGAASLFKKRSEAEGGRRFIGKIFDKLKARKAARQAAKAAETATSRANKTYIETMEEQGEIVRGPGGGVDSKGRPLKTREELVKSRNLFRGLAITAGVFTLIAIGYIIVKLRSE